MPTSNNGTSHKKDMKRQKKTEGLGDVNPWYNTSAVIKAVADGIKPILQLKKGPRGPFDDPSPNLKKKKEKR